MIGRSVMKSVLVASVCFCVTWCQAADEGAPSVRQLSDEDFAAGIVLTKIGTGEAFDFSAPEEAEVCADWEAFGAARDWFRLCFGVEDDVDEYASEGWSFAMGTNRVDSFTVFSYGTVRPSVTNVNTCISPLNAVIGIVPVSNHGMLDAADRPSRFWHYLTPSNTLQLTWQNVLLDREVSKPVSFQAEIDMLGNITFKYDLSRLTEDALANLSVGVMNEGRGRMFSCLPRDITSLRWRYLDPSLPEFSDHDGDGISTSDELFVYGTDPYSADTDCDGLTDGEEIAVMKTNPTDRYSSDPRFIDSVASALGGADPYSCPNGDGRTAFENVVYTGSSGGRGGEPASDSSAAVLEISAVGSGRGVLMVGNDMVPLLQGVNPIKVAVPKGRRTELKCELEGELYLNYNSSDFCIGRLPYGVRERGWVMFPNVEAAHPCIHNDMCIVKVGLDPGVNDDGFTCTWSSSTEDVGVENLPPLSAKLSFGFPRMLTASVCYKIRHPKHLFGESVFRQVCEYCPKIEDGEDHSSTKDYDDNEPTNDSNSEPDWCDEHLCLREWCMDRHGGGGGGGAYLPELISYSGSISNKYVTATNSPGQFEYVLKLHRPKGVSEKYDSQKIHIEVPADKVHCCNCEWHWAGNASIGYKDHRVNVHYNGAPFVRTTENCDLTVYGVAPSSEFCDSRVSIRTNGVKWAEFNYTVFGVSIIGRNVDLRKLNELNSDFGMPVVINTNLNNAAEIVLCTDVNLPDGVVRLAFENAKARMQLWMSYWSESEDCIKRINILDSETCPSREFTIQEWRSLVGKATSDRETTLQLLAYGRGSAKLFFGYAGGKDGKYLHDEAVQTITAIRPPLLPDYNRDGKIDDADAWDYSNGRIKYFWANQDGWQGDDAFQHYSDGLLDIDWSYPDLPKSNQDDEVNGKNDLVNLCPIAVDLSQFFESWKDKGVSFEFVTGSPMYVRFVPIDTAWNAVRSIVRKGQSVIGSRKLLHESKLLYTECDRKGNELPYEIPEALLKLGSNSSGMLAVEFAEPDKNMVLRIRIREKHSEEVICEFPLKVCVLDVHDMYRWVDMYSIAGNADNVPSEYAKHDKVLWPSTEHSDASVVFVHGYNMHPSEAWDWSQAMFKRLWWSGLDAEFTSVLWCGNHSQCWLSIMKTFAAINYHQNVYNAFKTAKDFAVRMNDIKAKRKFFIAHSLGNMLVSEARQYYGLEYDKYIMLNAAVPVEAYDRAGTNNMSKSCMTPSDWHPYADRVRSTHWYELFDPGDARHGLTWNGHFDKVDKTVNFYSSKDEVVADGDGGAKWLFTRNFAWYNQDREKGVTLVSATPEAGWVFSQLYRNSGTIADPTHNISTVRQTWTLEKINALSKVTLRKAPVFKMFRHPEVCTEDGNAFLRINKSVGWHILSHGMPTESFAAGANPVLKWDVSGVAKKKKSRYSDKKRKKQNYNMQDECGDHTGKWKHSYFIQMSMFDTGGLFEKIIEEIN